ncbi:prenyltransferase/squalene oxidase repeat-containing protein [Salinigranum halophilum]|uniref:antibiotic ABC transporter permease n=1 Tax=Salinigranum halophilum TaxID=2565931 RepID=UPI0010A81182|nr:antibiotic ABC transporter permease [Salinigranum halophilum]
MTRENIDPSNNPQLERLKVTKSDFETVSSVILDTLSYSYERDYIGYDYFDGMSSRVLQALPFDNKWVNIAFQEGIKRFPVNLRPIFLVEQRQNFKGTALFVIANCCAYDLTDDDFYKDEAVKLADWLIDNQSDGFDGFCGGHRHEMQQLREKRDAEVPNIIPTSFAVKALLTASRFEQRFEDYALKSVDFVQSELEYREVENGAKIKYQPLEDGSYYTLNGGAIGARMFVDLYDHFGDKEYLNKATKLLDYLTTKQTELGGWMYREPASASHLSMDNHHNGFIIESYHRYATVTGSNRYYDTLETSAEFYKSLLFNLDGSPNWEETSSYPKDIHACAQGIITFSLLGDHEFAEKIIDWTINNLYGGDGEFYYQKRRVYTKRFTLMRWCQAWMAYALSVYHLTKQNDVEQYYI